MKRRGIQVLVHGSTLKISVINKDNDITTMSTLDEYEFQVSCKLLAALSVVLKAHHSPDEDFSIKCYEELFAITVFDICIKDTLLFEETSRDQLDDLIDLNRLRLIDRMHDNFLTLKYMKGWVAGPEDEARVEKNLDIFPIHDIYKLCNRQKALYTGMRTKSSKTIFKLRTLLHYTKQQKQLGCLHRDPPVGSFHV